MVKKRILIIALLLTLGIATRALLPPDVERELRLDWLFYVGAALVAMLRDFGRAAQKASEVALPPDAVVLFEGPANFKNGWLMVGGVLKLTPDKLVFSAHGFAQKARIFGWELRDFKDATLSNTLGIMPNSILVRVGSIESKFVVMNREGWLKQIRAAAAKLKS